MAALEHVAEYGYSVFELPHSLLCCRIFCRLLFLCVLCVFMHACVCVCVCVCVRDARLIGNAFADCQEPSKAPAQLTH